MVRQEGHSDNPSQKSESVVRCRQRPSTRRKLLDGQGDCLIPAVLSEHGFFLFLTKGKAMSIAEQLNKLLQDDANFSTRAGLRFMTELVKDAFEFIESEKARTKDEEGEHSKLEARITNIETKLDSFLKLRKEEQEKAEAERTRWRWAIITPTLGLVIVEAARWLLS